MKKAVISAILICFGIIVFQSSVYSFSIFGDKIEELEPQNGAVSIPVADIDDGKSHHYQVKAADGTMVTFFVLQSLDGVIRAAIDACDVCYRSGKGYVQEGQNMVCTNCGRKFAADRINEVRGGCNPAPLERRIEGDSLVIEMSAIDSNSWYCEYRPENR